MFTDLELTLKLILEKLENQEELLQLSISSLTTKKEVARFLKRTEKTIDNYVKKKIFLIDVHYFYNEQNRVEFIPFAILQFKKQPFRRKKELNEIDKTKKIYHPSVKHLAQGLRVG